MADVFFHPLRQDGVFRIQKRIKEATEIKRRSLPPHPTTANFQAILASFNANGGPTLIAEKNQPRLSVVIYRQEDGDIFAVLIMQHRVTSSSTSRPEEQIDICGTLEPPDRLL